MWKTRQQDRRTSPQRSFSNFERRSNVEHRISEFESMPFQRVEPSEYAAIRAAADDFAIGKHRSETT